MRSISAFRKSRHFYSCACMWAVLYLKLLLTTVASAKRRIHNTLYMYINTIDEFLKREREWKKKRRMNGICIVKIEWQPKNKFKNLRCEKFAFHRHIHILIMDFSCHWNARKKKSIDCSMTLLKKKLFFFHLIYEFICDRFFLRCVKNEK